MRERESRGRRTGGLHADAECPRGRGVGARAPAGADGARGDGVLVRARGAGAGGGAEGRPACVLVHGLGWWSFIWKRLADALLESGKVSVVIAFDRYGRGGSSPARDAGGAPSPHTPDLFVEQILELVKHLGSVPESEGGCEALQGTPGNPARFILAGTSLGGLIAASFAAAHPERVLKLVLMAPVGLRHPPEYFSLPARLIRVRALGWGIFSLVGRAVQLESIRRDRFKIDFGKDVEAEDPEMFREVTDATTWQVAEKEGYLYDFFQDVTEVPMGGLHAEVERIGAGHSYPVAILWGTEDSRIPFSFAETWTAKIPRAKLYVVEGGSHADYLLTDRLPEVVRSVCD